jgi:PPOX class probable F420-dependent enzyme
MHRFDTLPPAIPLTVLRPRTPSRDLGPSAVPDRLPRLVPMLDPQAIAFVRDAGFGVVSTVGPDGAPQSAGVKMTASDDGSLLFATTATSRKARNLAADPRVAVVVDVPGASLQAEGSAAIPEGAQREDVVEHYLKTYPEELDRARQDGFTPVRVELTWQRLTDYRHA